MTSRFTLKKRRKITNRQLNTKGYAPSARSGGVFSQIPRWLPLRWIAVIPLAAIIVAVWGVAAQAQDNGEALTADDVKVMLDSLWVLVAAVLVFFMNAGFGMLETGFCRQKNAVNILSKNLIVFGLALIIFWAFGFSFMFSEGNSFIGTSGFFLTGDADTYGAAPLPKAVVFLFQGTFAATAATIVSGAVAERIRFSAFIIFSLLLVGLSYCISGHWVWSGNAWLGDMGFSDFAGSTVVHSVGGWAALTGAFLLGPRIGKYEDGQPRAIPGHNMSIATLGCLILWLGWFGFNPGSQLAADIPEVPMIAVVTSLAASAGAVSATLTSWLRDGKPDLSMIINGILAGLVAITAPCDAVNTWQAVIIGLIGGVLVVFAVAFFDRIGIDDPVGAISVHLVNGIWGTLAYGIFGGANIGIQLLGIVAVGAFTVITSTIFWLILKAAIGIRVSPEEELQGLDIGEHGMEAYSGFLKEAGASGIGTGRPSGMPGEMAGSQ